MSGRGINISVQHGDDLLRLHVARHAPLWTLLDELYSKTGVRQELQALVLVDEADETDSTLLDEEDWPLYHLGVQDGSRLVLTALEDTAPGRRDDEPALDPPDDGTESFFVLEPPEGSPRAAAPKAVTPRRRVHRRKLETRIQPRGANHSYNGVM